ncbi:hypothetical protein [Photobacterium leiognathi]|uniref:hypothetical protein n=1 Tax=Photobacterium leiognathi TaxID=553611 RepID=UPI0029815A12|nr:hypothetical protein [Photobacterium leiognathi]
MKKTVAACALALATLAINVDAHEMSNYAQSISATNVSNFTTILRSNSNYQEEPFALSWSGKNDEHNNTQNKKKIIATKFTQYSPINIGAGAWFNNEKMPFGQKIISKSGWRSNEKIGRDYLTTEQLYQPISSRCDAVFSANTGITGNIMINATGALALRCSGVTSLMEVTIQDPITKKVLRQLHSQLFTDQNNQNAEYAYQHAFLVNDFLQVVNLKEKNKPLNVCLKIQYDDQSDKCVVGLKPNQHELDLIEVDYKKWKKHSLWYKTGFVKTNSWTHGYEVWYLSLMKKYLDYQWVGF